MCAVIGYSAGGEPREEHFQMLLKLWAESRIRGLHAFGFAVQNERGHYVKRFHSLMDCVAELRRGWPFARMIGHCRYSTSGDWLDSANNQPLMIGETALAFNGVISMGTKDEMQRQYHLNMQTDNDGEIALDRFARGPVDFASWIQTNHYSFAGLFLDQDGMTVIRNQKRPLYRAEFGGARFYASTLDILARAGLNEVTLLKPGELERA